jgi:hydrogenase large subunit
MCFRNLPVDFDSAGNPFLKGGIPDPYATGHSVLTPPDTQPLTHDKIRDLLARNGHIKSVDFDPVTRVAGALAFHAVADLKERKIIDVNSMATLFRGYEIIMIGRDPRDAIFITSRACGVCGGVHSTCSALATEMAFGIQPPPMGIVVRNMMLSMEFLYDHPLHLFLLAGPDYSEVIVKATNPEIWEKAQKTDAPGGATHGYRTMGELMRDMNPLSGKLYVEALQMTRVAREAYVVLGGKYPHPETIVPGGISTTVTPTTFNLYYSRLAQLFDYSKKVVAIWDDITEFFYACNPLYRKVGSRAASMIDVGIWDDPDAYDTTYKNCNEWGEKRWATPGVIVDGELKTTKLQNINLGLEEFIDHSYYEGWDGHRFKEDPLGAPLSPYHPWNKVTNPKPSGQNWREKYTWSTAPRWDRMVTEGGAYARVYNTALAKKIPSNSFIESTGRSLKILVPKGALPETEMEWNVPPEFNAFERNRARAYAFAYTCMVAMNDWLRAQDLTKKGDTKVSTKFEIPKRGTQIGVGFWGAGRGWLTHHMVVENGTVANYQIITPSTINASPRDPWGNTGAYEQAVLNTPILETFASNDDYKGIDVLRTIRSFDPCMPCTTHMYVEGSDKVVTREVNTCACGVD